MTGNDFFMVFKKLYVIIPIILTIVTLITFYNLYQKKKYWAECRGTITGFKYVKRMKNTGDSAEISPVINYEINGNCYELVGNYYSTSMREGMDVKLLYKKDDHNKATVKTGVYIAPIILSIITVVSVFVLVIFSLI